jgi:predicted RNase H-like HicB family nuclease
MRVKYVVSFEQAENNWAAYVPDLSGCMTTGKTLEQTEINIRDSARFSILDAEWPDVRQRLYQRLRNENSYGSIA